MALIVLEGLDRTGKSTVAEYFASKGYEIVHMSAPPKGMTQDLFLQEMSDLISSAASRDICLDRSYYGEACIWPTIYGRESLLSYENLDVLREIEDAVGTQRILMYDPKVEEHWKRCVDNNEPLTKVQFTRARTLYSQMANQYGFELVTLPAFLNEYPEAKEFTVQITNNEVKVIEDKLSTVESTTPKHPPGKTKEQIKLEQANTINEILSKRILKQKGEMYDSLENEIRSFLNAKLGQLLGTTNPDSTVSLSREEILFYKTMFKRAMKENN